MPNSQPQMSTAGEQKLLVLRSPSPNQSRFKGFCSDWLYWCRGLKPVGRWSSVMKGECSVTPMEGSLGAPGCDPAWGQ